ncbi:hypothetical protein CHRY9390_01462 [Chryseobacterium aquaeductus]|uniref:GLPGLI family protein n=1 Tax=Chryseobacterium aquaeductus TaxID=2675056 RepID=A0A9N8MFH6_9FLAO|nr:GLPGLI family protein [Chryseobacterium aquaeductus]CAA7330789.1 hypothetical protein CHRY9390_01462 [Chryseobacterium potabilaquae]CAD7806093.1 hypothetical protein CHRY9390_01462 [Chryseobacterium aquaeductus]
MKKYFVLSLVFWLGTYIKSQEIEFEPLIKATYTSSLKYGSNFRVNQTFILLGNAKDYYFAGYKNYLKDTDQEEVLKKGSGITLTIGDYFQERLIKQNDAISLFGMFRDERLIYDEKVVLKWVLYSDTKIINGIKCQMAATNKYGRRWIAYFSTEHQIPIGPYKFTGLPGLIFEIYDTRDEYHFTLIKLEKNTDDFEFSLKGYKKFNKKDFLKASYNLEFTTSGFPMEADMRKEFEDILEAKKKRYNNPLELKPFE